MKLSQYVLIFAVAVLVRATIFGMSNWTVPYVAIMEDSKEYMQYGRNLAERGVFSSRQEPPYYRSAHRTPMYPLLIAGALKLMPTENAAIFFVLWLQFALSGLTACLCAAIVHLLARDARWGFVAGILAGLAPRGIYYSMFTVTEATFTFTFTLAVYLVFRHLRVERSNRWLWVAAFLFGIASLIKPAAHYAIIFGLPILLLSDKRHSLRARFLRTVVPVLAVYWIVLLPWLVRNWNDFRFFSLAQSGVMKAAAAAAIVAGQNNSHEYPSFAEFRAAYHILLSECHEEFNRTHPEPLQSPPDVPIVYPEHLTAQFDNLVGLRSAQIIRTHFSTYLRYAALNGVRILFGVNKDEISRALKIPPSEGKVSLLIGSLVRGKLAEAANESRKIRVLDYVSLLWSCTYQFGITGLAAVAFILLIHKREWQTVVFFLCIITVLILLPSLAVLSGAQSARYRSTVMPYFIILAGYALHDITGRWHARKGKQEYQADG